MIQEALNIMEEESTREDNEVISSLNLQCSAGNNFFYSHDRCPVKSYFWSDILQIGPDIIYGPTTP